MEIGATVNQYRIINRIGEGGMGVVYLAEDTRLHRKVALKFISNLSSKSTEEIARFSREAQAAARLNHPNICTVYELGETDNQTYIAMEYVEGFTLKKRLKEGSIDEHDIRDWLEQIARGLLASHEAGVVHRDVKPANIMITSNGLVKIMDFGIAKLVEADTELTKADTTIGTIAYMSPEQARGEDIDQRTDIWSVGVILFEMLTGKRPFEGAFREAVMYAMMHEDITPVSSIKPESSPQLGVIVEQCLQREKDKRYISLRNVLDDLTTSDDFFENAKISSSPLPSEVRAKQVVPLWVLASILIIIIGIIGTLLYEPNEKNTQINSLAVYPFGHGIGTEPDLGQEATEQIWNRLKSLRQLDVAPLSQSSELFKRGLLAETALDMDANAYLHGEVTERQDSFHIQVYLSDSRTGEQVWTQSYVRAIQETMGLYDDVIRGIAEAVDLVISPEENRYLAANRKVDPTAMRLYIRGRKLRAAQDKNGPLRAINSLNEAIALDSSFAEAYSEIAYIYYRLAYTQNPHNVWPKAREAAEKAISIDSTLHLAWAALGTYKQLYEWNWPGAEEAYLAALKINPDPRTRVLYATLLAALGRTGEARQQITLARQSDDYSKDVRLRTEIVYLFIRDYTAGIAHSKETLNIHPDYNDSRILLATYYALSGDYPRAVMELDKVMPRPGEVSKSPMSPLMISWGMGVYAIASASEKAKTLIPELESYLENQLFCTYELGLVYVHLGEFDKAYEWFHRSMDDRAICMPYIKVDPRMDPFRTDSRYLSMLNRVGLND